MLGISSKAGKAAVYVSTRWRILSAIYGTSALLPTYVEDKSYMLIDQENPNVLPLSCEPIESFFDGCVVGLAVDD